MPKELLKVEGLKKYFPIVSGLLRREVDQVKAVDGVSFSVKKGKVLGIVGESGCGKSTTARASIDLIPPTSGIVSWEGKELSQMTPQEKMRFRQEVQIVFQDPSASLNPRKTIGESIGEGLLYHGIVENVAQMRERVKEVLERIGISPGAIDRYPHQFSGGQQQRICIGRAYIMQPKLIVCDEAVSALDVSVQAQILNLLLDLQEESGLSYLFISHDLSVVRYISDYVLVMFEGAVVEEGEVEAIFDAPQHPYTQMLFSSIPRAFPLRRG